MTPQLEEAQRMLRLARRDQIACAALLRVEGLELAVACFHAQQATEKALKAVMCLRGIEYQRTHDLEELAGKLTDAAVAIPVGQDELAALTPYAVQFRYDEEVVNLISGQEAEALVARVLAWADAKISEEA